MRPLLPMHSFSSRVICARSTTRMTTARLTGTTDPRGTPTSNRLVLRRCAAPRWPCCTVKRQFISPHPLLLSISPSLPARCWCAPLVLVWLRVRFHYRCTLHLLSPLPPFCSLIIFAACFSAVALLRSRLPTRLSCTHDIVVNVST